MKLLHRAVTGLGLVLALPAAVSAQSVKPADLVGVWMSDSTASEKSWVWLFTADSTYVGMATDHYNKEKEKGEVHTSAGNKFGIRGDTLVLGGQPAYTLKLEGQQLTATTKWNTSTVYKRTQFPAPTSKVFPPTPPKAP